MCVNVCACVRVVCGRGGTWLKSRDPHLAGAEQTYLSSKIKLARHCHKCLHKSPDSIKIQTALKYIKSECMEIMTSTRTIDIHGFQMVSVLGWFQGICMQL